MNQHHNVPVGTVLLLEDEMLIALDLEETLIDAGFTDVQILSSCSAAEAWLEMAHPILAILDSHLRDGTCGNIACTLAARQIPFIVYSGNSLAIVEEEPVFAKGQLLTKPAPPEAILQAIRRTPLPYAARNAP